MGKIEKKRKKLQDRIKFLQDELTQSLTKKTSTTVEIIELSIPWGVLQGRDINKKNLIISDKDNI